LARVAQLVGTIPHGVIPNADIVKAQTVAYLHDIVEDTAVTLPDLNGFGDDVARAVGLLTRTDGVAYTDYIDGLLASGDRLALAVKIADLTDHLRPSCPERLRPRYEAALARLTAQWHHESL
jgi:(p)ppGpp synthase/HD superfamily hydrolase